MLCKPRRRSESHAYEYIVPEEIRTRRPVFGRAELVFDGAVFLARRALRSSSHRANMPKYVLKRLRASLV